jgi:hypothetical protein
MRASDTAGRRGRLPRLERRHWLWAGFWALFILSVLGLLSDPAQNPGAEQVPLALRVAVSPLGLFVLWIALLWFRAPLQAVIRRISLPGWAKFALVGLLFGICLAANFSISFNIYGQDIHPDPLLNTALYIGIYGGVMLGWYILKAIYAFNYRHVFWIGGLVFSMFEQNYILPLTILGGGIVLAPLLLAYLVVSYGVPFATPFLMMPEEELPQGQRKLGRLGYVLCAALPLLLFIVCGNVWFWLLDRLLGLGDLNI